MQNYQNLLKCTLCNNVTLLYLFYYMKLELYYEL